MSYRSILALVCAGLVACAPDPAQELPRSALIEAGISLAVDDLGVFSDAEVTRIVGKRYLPSLDAFQVIACYRFVTPTGSTGEECDDSFRLFQLDNGRWMVSINRQNVYRWREVPRSSAELLVPADPEG